MINIMIGNRTLLDSGTPNRIFIMDNCSRFVSVLVGHIGLEKRVNRMKGSIS